MASNRNPAISLCRVCSMCMIVLCHIIRFYTFIPGHNFLGQILNVGVFSFFAISGYLYGTKDIGSFAPWIRKRCATVLLPASIITVFVLAFGHLSAGGGHSLSSAVIHLLNLQGIGFLYPGFYRYFQEIELLGPLWFITIIMLCYCMVPLLQRMRVRICRFKHGYLLSVAAAAVCYVINLLAGINLSYFLTFAIGYFIAASGKFDRLGKADFAIISAIMLSTQLLRLLLRAGFDGTPVYLHFALYSHIALGVWILCFFFALKQFFPEFAEMLGNSSMVSLANAFSMYVYMTHYCFCRGPLNFYTLIPDLFGATVCFGAATLAAAFALKYLTEYAQRILSKKR